MGRVYRDGWLLLCLRAEDQDVALRSMIVVMDVDVGVFELYGIGVLFNRGWYFVSGAQSCGIRSESKYLR